MAYQVKSPLVLVKDAAGSVQYLYQGATLPAYVGTERVKELSDEGHIEKVASEPAASEPKQGKGEAPAKNGSLEKWQEFARTKGATDADLEGKTRDDLVAAYGS